MIIKFDDLREWHEYKKGVILSFLMSYYKDLFDSGEELNLPYFLEAQNMYHKLINSCRDVNFYYNKIKQYNKV